MHLMLHKLSSVVRGQGFARSVSRVEEGGWTRHLLLLAVAAGGRGDPS
jgi:hypothetical protein